MVSNMKRVISLSISFLMLISMCSFGAVQVWADAGATLETLKACADGEEIVSAIKSLDSAAVEELGIDLTNFNKAKYPKHIGNALYVKKDSWTTAEEFKTDFEAVVEEYIPTKVYTPVKMADATYGRKYTNIASWEELKAIDATYTTGKTAQNFMLKAWGVATPVNTHYFKSLYQYQIEKSDYITEAGLTVTLAGWTGNNTKANVNILVDGYKNDNFENAGTAYTLPDQKIWTATNASGVNQLNEETEPTYRAVFEAFSEYDKTFTDINGIAYSWKALEAATEPLEKTVSLTPEQIALLFGGTGESEMIFRTNANNSTTNVNVTHTPVTIKLTYDYTVRAENLVIGVWNKINPAQIDAATLANNLKALSAEECGYLGIDTTVFCKLSYPKHAAKRMLDAKYANAETFKTAFESAMNEVVRTKTVSMKYFDEGDFYLAWKYGAEDSPNSTSPYKGRKGVQPNWGRVVTDTDNDSASAFYLDKDGHYLYLTFHEIQEHTAVINGTMTFKVQDHKGNHEIYADKFSYATIPNYEMANYNPAQDTNEDKVALDNAVMAAWEAYDEAMTADAAPTTLSYTGESNTTALVSKTAVMSDAIVGAIKLSEGNLTVRLSSNLANNTVVQGNVKLNLDIDQTIRMESEQNQYAGLINALNTITDATANDAVLNFIAEYKDDLTTDEEVQYKFTHFANSVQIQIIKELAAKQLDDIEAIRREFDRLTNAAKGVQYKYKVASIDFVNYTDAEGHDVNGDGTDDSELGAVRSVKVQKLSNTVEDFTMIYAAYKGGRLVNIQVIDSKVSSATARGRFYNTLKTAKDGEVVEDTWSFYTQHKPDEVKIFIFDSLSALSPISEPGMVSDTKIDG